MPEDPTIELRSEKARSMIGQIPPYLYRRGMTLIAVLFVLLVLAICFVPYPEIKKLTLQVNTNPQFIEIRADENGVFHKQMLNDLDIDGNYTIYPFIKEGTPYGDNDLLALKWPNDLSELYFTSELSIDDFRIIKSNSNMTIVAYDRGYHPINIKAVIEESDVIYNIIYLKIGLDQSSQELKNDIIPALIYEGKLKISQQTILSKLLNKER